MAVDHRTGLYIFSLERQASAALGKNFISMYNPTGSGKSLSLGGIFASYYAIAAGPAYPLRGYRATTTPTGGTLAGPTEICQFDSAHPPSVAEIRYNDPAATLDGAFFNSPSGIVANTVGGVHEIDAPAGFNPFLVRPGESIILRQNAGTANFFWNLSILWREVAP